MSEVPDIEPEYGVIRPTLKGGEPDRLDFHSTRKYNTREWAEREVTAWREKGERAHVVVRQWELWRPTETQAANAPRLSVPCAWCDENARGSAHYSERWFPSCGRLLHGWSFEPTERWKTT